MTASRTPTDVVAPPGAGEEKRMPDASTSRASSTKSSDEFEPRPPRWIRPVRDRVHRLPAGELVWKIGIAVVGGAVVAGGLLLIPLPGPGWAIVFLGVAVWATEFHWAQRLLHRGRLILRAWTVWTKRQSRPVQAMLGLVGLAFVATVVYLTWHFLL